MNHRTVIEIKHQLTPPVIALLQPDYRIDLSKVRIEVQPFWWQTNIGSPAATGGDGTVWFQPPAWREFPAANLLKHLAHELCHSEQKQTRNILRKYWDGLILPVLISIRSLRWYPPNSIPVEIEAMARADQVFSRLSQVQQLILDQPW